MNRQEQIDAFLLKAHQLALARLRAQPARPEELTVSRELDLYPSLDPAKADLIDGAIGAMSMIEADTLLDRITRLDSARYPLEAITTWARRRIAEAQP